MTYQEQEARELVVQAGQKLVERGLVARTWGNISARISATHFVITPSGLAYENLKPEDLVKVKIADCTYAPGRKPSSEKGIHAAVYRRKPEVGFVIHTHQDYASCVGVGGKDLTGVTDPVLGERVPCAAYGMPSTKKLQAGVEVAMERCPEAKAILMRQHGALCMAPDFEGAFTLAQALEAAARTVLERTVVIPRVQQPKIADLMQHLKAATADMHFYVEAAPEVQAVAARGKTLHPHLDDLAQIAGVTIRCVSSDAETVLKALRGRGAVLVKGVGAICCARDTDDLEAIAAIMRKSCMTALYAAATNAAPLSRVDRTIMRLVYTMKYSKKKTEK